MKIRLLIPALVLVLLAAACAAPPELRNDANLQDTSLITGEPCEAPCWRGITPGETSWADAMIIIEDDPQLTDLQAPQVDEETQEVATTFNQRDGATCCLIYSADGTTLDQMLLQFAPDMTLSQVIDHHGDPTYMSGTEISEDQAAAALYYPDKQLIVYAFVAGITGDITAESEIFAALYLREEDFDDILINSELRNWDGYAALQDYISRDPDITPQPQTEDEASADESNGVDAPADSGVDTEAESTDTGEGN